MEFLEISEQEFASFASLQDNENFWQSTDMAHMREWNGWTCCYVGVKEKDTIVAASLLSYRKVFMGLTFVQAIRGFYIDYHNTSLMKFFHEHLSTYLKTLNCMYFKTDPYLPLRERDINGNLVEGGFDNADVVKLMTSFGYSYQENMVGNDLSREPNFMFVKNLIGETEEQLLTEFDHQTRWSVRKTIKTGITVKEATKEDLPEFKKIMDHTAERRDFEDHDMRYYEGLYETFGKSGNLKILFAQLNVLDYLKRIEHEKEQALVEMNEIDEVLQAQPNSKKYNKKKKVVEEQLELLAKQQAEGDKLHAQGDVLNLATAVFLTVGKEILYLYSGAYKEYMKYNGPYAIQWHMFKYGINNGYKRYNFYGISGIFDESADDYGVYEFKKGFTGNVEELLGDFYLYMNPAKYNIYQSLRKVKKIIKR